MIMVPRTLPMVRSVVAHVLLVSVCCFTVFPFLWMAVSSLKTKAEVMAADTFLPSSPQYGNYLEILFRPPFRVTLPTACWWQSVQWLSRSCAAPCLPMQ